MEINVKQNNNVTLLEIFKDGQPVTQTNPVEPSELAACDFPDVCGEIAIVSGFPGWANNFVSLKAKNLFQVVASFDPKKGGGIVTHSTNADYQVGAIIPLA